MASETVDEKMKDLSAVEPAAESSTPTAPEGFIIHTEGTTSILFKAPPGAKSSAATESTSSAVVFLNPVQQYNRDLSVVAIRTWSEQRQVTKAQKWEEQVMRKREKRHQPRGKGKRKAAEGVAEGGEAGVEGEGEGKRARLADGGKEEDVKLEEPKLEAVQPAEPAAGAEAGAAEGTVAAAEPAKVNESKPAKPFTAPTFTFTLLEALSATGLRAIRYAKELPLLRHVTANDLSASAVQDIHRNIAFNGLTPKGLPAPVEGAPALSKWEADEAVNGKVRVNEGDACAFMYQHRAEGDRFDCVDLDPYGSAVPFLDAAIGAVADGGLLCVTCTDMAVLAGHNYPEKCYTHYGGVCVNAEFSHEVGLRLVLHSIATTAARYGRHIEPLLSLSIDFYCRVFVRIDTSPKEVKAMPTKTSLLYYCHDCQTPHTQAFGRVSERVSAKNGQVNLNYHAPSGPPPGVGDKCGQCGGKFAIGGPMWMAPIHDQAFVQSMLDHVGEHGADFATAERITGMLTVAKNEVPNSPFYFTPAKLCGFFHCTSPPIHVFASALLNGGYQVSRSHASAGSLKTDAPREFVMDVVREWIKENPVKMDKIKENSPTYRLLQVKQTHEVNLAPHPDVATALLDKASLVRYQVNPLPNWGPARGAIKGTAPTHANPNKP